LKGNISRGPHRRILLLTGPGLLFLTCFLFAPMVFLLVMSFRIGSTWTVQPYLSTLSTDVFRVAFFRTLRVAAIVTLVTTVLGYPSAYLIARLSPRYKAILMAVAMFPLMTTAVVRTFGWFVILGRNGILDKFLLALGLVTRPVQFMYTEGAIVVGLTHLFFPLMLLSLISALENVPAHVEEAAQSLGAHPLRAFWKVVFPLSSDGLVVGGTLVFTGCITAYTTPAILGGTRVLTMATLLQQQAMTLLNWESATVIAVVLLAVAATVNLLLRRLRPKERMT
jgi:putative spermidine/putrescine transport system permease protein